MSKERHDEYMARMTAEEKLIASEKQIGGNHYKDRVIQPIDYIVKNNLDFLEGNVVKYITRWREKGGIEDLKKARQYIDFLIKKEVEKSK